MAAVSRSRSARAASVLVGITLLAIPAASSAHARHHRVRHAPRSTACVNANVRATAAPIPVMRTAVVCLLNKQRVSRGLPALHADSRLNNSAQAWSNVMVGQRIFTHGSNFAARISAAGFVWSSAGENIATGFGTPNQVVNAWMASAGHCANILSPNYADVGTGVNARPVSGYASNPSTWTNDFALPMGAQAPSGNWGPANGCPY